MVNLQTNIILLGFKKAFDVIQNFNIQKAFLEGPYEYMQSANMSTR